MSVDQSPMNQLITDNIDIWTSTVKTKSASGRGSSKKRELYGVKKLRELILELAVRGKLVPQDPTDEPASVLLERIAEEKAQLVKDKKIKKPKKLSEISPEDKLFDLPEGWSWERLGNIGDTNIGLTYSPKDVGDTGTPVLRSANIQKNRIDLKELVRVNTEVKNSAYVSRGDLLICARNGSKALVGKTAKIGDLNEPMAFGAFMAIFRSQINSYVEVFLNSPVYRRNLDGVSTTTINQITQSNLRATLCAVPPYSEQHRIVAKVDELMTLCDQLEQQTEASIEAHQLLVTTLLDTLTNSADTDELMQNWARISEHFDTLFTTEASIDQLKQTILQLAVMGKLVPQDPTDEPAAKLLERVAIEKAQLIKDKKIKKQKALPPISDDEKPFELPSGWEWCRFGDLCKLVTSGSRGWKAFYANTGATFIRSQDIKYDRVEFDERAYVQLPKSTEGKRTRVDVGNLLMTITGANVAKVAVVEEQMEEAYVSQHVALIKLIDSALIDYLHVWLTGSMGGRGLLLQSSYGAKPGLNLQNINELLVPLAPILELNRVVFKVRELLIICEQLKGSLKESQTTQLYLTDAIVEQVV
ncbi:restriction endonuclease subunit S [Vibrio rarus]|uniref:restriction endonuclease subunit S n=1 Tax=Vibrio rarus TaxID=413403 RepID=UPI0021C3A822|nr:restriction endonuclease subunit S [Vibrio rarus]